MSIKHTQFDEYVKKCNSRGVIVSSEGQLFTVDGLKGAHPGEKVVLSSGAEAFVFGVGERTTDLVLVSGNTPATGEEVVRTEEQMAFPCSEHLIGKILSPLGVDYVTSEHHHAGELAIESKAAGIAKRAKITTSLRTGSLLVDTLLPLGRGQRELLLGDRKTGKTQFALNTLITQAKLGTVCIYVAIGKPLSSVKELIRKLEDHKVLDQTAIIASSPSDPAGLIYLTPFSGMRLAEYFRDLGRDVLIVLDDLTTHARSYRQLSLLARRFPGRNAYPGDIFYLHARLLERAGNFKVESKTVSITCLPIAETQQGDFTGYIQTNLMSMTDGHLYFDEERFLEGQRPAIHPFLSVTRVGRQTKSSLLRETISEITSFLSRGERLAQLSHFGQELSDDAKVALHKAEKFGLLFKLEVLGRWEEWFQFFMIALIWDGYWLTSEADTLKTDMERLHTLSREHHQYATAIQTLGQATSLADASKQARSIADQMFAHQQQ